MEGQLSLFDDCPTANFQFKGKLLRIEDGQRIVSYDFYCSHCGNELFHNAEMMKEMTACPFCNANIKASKNLLREFDISKFN